MTTIAATAPSPHRSLASSDRRFFLSISIVIALVVFAGFAPTYYLRGYYQTEPLPRVFAVHGAVFSAWVVLFVVQAALVSARRTDIHRKLGVVGGLLAVLMLVMGYQAAIAAARRGFSTPGLPPPLVFLAVPIVDLVVFPALVGSALWYRRNPAAHKRLMLLAMLAVITAAIARLPGVLPFGPPAFFGLTDLFLLAGIAWDKWTRGRVHPAYIWGGLFLVLSQPLRLVVSGTDTWMKIATWLTA
jgi:drug/metabolite transporter superfamily protein YnfA